MSRRNRILTGFLMVFTVVATVSVIIKVRSHPDFQASIELSRSESMKAQEHDINDHLGGGPGPIHSFEEGY